MADVELAEASGTGVRPRPSIFYLLSGCMVVLAVLSCLCSGLIFVNPRIGLNPFPPPTATLTPGPTNTPTNTPRPPTRTPAPTPTRAVTPEASATPAAAFDAVITATRQYVAGRTCEDISFAGEVRDANNQPLTGYTVEVSRTDGFRRTAVSGGAKDYGEGGWEVKLTGEPVHKEYTIMLFDANGVSVGPALEPQVTSNNCDESLILINFQQK